jgi:hypothetical protein
MAVKLFNELICRLDDEIIALSRTGSNVEKIRVDFGKYVVATGLPELDPLHHAPKMAEVALRAIEVVNQFCEDVGTKLMPKIGIATGDVVAGVIGASRYQYDLIGDAANVAARMCQLGAGGQIQVTDNAYALLKSKYEFKARGPIAVKGKGMMETYWLIGRRPDWTEEPLVRAAPAKSSAVNTSFVKERRLFGAAQAAIELTFQSTPSSTSGNALWGGGGLLDGLRRCMGSQREGGRNPRRESVVEYRASLSSTGGDEAEAERSRSVFVEAEVVLGYGLFTYRRASRRLLMSDAARLAGRMSKSCCCRKGRKGSSRRKVQTVVSPKADVVLVLPKDTPEVTRRMSKIAYENERKQSRAQQTSIGLVARNFFGNLFSKKKKWSKVGDNRGPDGSDSDDEESGFDGEMRLLNSRSSRSSTPSHEETAEDKAVVQAEEEYEILVAGRSLLLSCTELEAQYQQMVREWAQKPTNKAQLQATLVCFLCVSVLILRATTRISFASSQEPDSPAECTGRTHTTPTSHAHPTANSDRFEDVLSFWFIPIVCIYTLLQGADFVHFAPACSRKTQVKPTQLHLALTSQLHPNYLYKTKTHRTSKDKFMITPPLTSSATSSPACHLTDHLLYLLP